MRPSRVRDVDVDAVADELPDGRDAGISGRRLDEHVRSANGMEVLARLIDGRLRIICERRRDLDAGEAINAAGLVVDGTEDIATAARMSAMINPSYICAGPAPVATSVLIDAS